MKFGAVPLADAEGALLAHSIVTPAMKKGRRLTAVDIASLRAAGRTDVIVARIEAGDVLEDIAAQRIASAIGGAGVRVAAPFTGRANLYALHAGLCTLDAAALAGVNAVDEGITIATVPAFERVEAGRMVATVKIIPFAVDDATVGRAESLARSAAIGVAPFTPHRVGLLLTTLPGTKANVLTKRERAIVERLGALGSTIAVKRTVEHDVDKVGAALQALAAAGASPLFVFAASAIIDRDDVIPTALIAAGGRVERLGMPVDPGNLLLLGTLGATPVIGIPSCAASPKLNGFDWVLERVMANLPVTGVDIAAMGVGGLLKEIAGRPQPRDRETNLPSSPRSAPRVAVIVLAAGRSSRMGSNKLLEPLGGKPIIRHVVDAARASSAVEVVVVTGNFADSIRRALAGLDVRLVDNPAFADGIATSLKAGLAALAPSIDAAVIALGDMPEVTAQHLDRLIAAFSTADNRSIVVPTRHGKRGNPVLWSRLFFEAMAGVSGDTGAKHLIGAHADQVVEVDLDSDAVLTDIDTPEALAALRSRHEA